jgi:hypothetical protein
MSNEIADAVNAVLSEALQDHYVAEEIVLGDILVGLREVCLKHGITRELPTLAEVVQRWRETADFYAAVHGRPVMTDQLGRAGTPGGVMKVWVTICSDNIAGVASTLDKAIELYGCGHDQDSYCCFIEEHEVDAAEKLPWQPPRCSRPPVVQEALPL